MRPDRARSASAAGAQNVTTANTQTTSGGDADCTLNIDTANASANRGSGARMNAAATVTASKLPPIIPKSKNTLATLGTRRPSIPEFVTTQAEDPAPRPSTTPHGSDTHCGHRY